MNNILLFFILIESKKWFNNDWIHTTIIDNKKVNIIKVKYIYNLCKHFITNCLTMTQ